MTVRAIASLEGFWDVFIYAEDKFIVFKPHHQPVPPHPQIYYRSSSIKRKPECLELK